jgi:acyl-CoA thioesterase FadM
VDSLAPTPIDAELELRARVREIKGRRVMLDISLSAKGVVCARGDVVAIQMPDDWIEKLGRGK